MVRYDSSLPREERKARGVFYTPEWIVRYIVDRTIQAGDTVLDPACGTGVFLTAAEKAGAKVHGIDSDPVALQLAAAAVPSAVLAQADAVLDPLPHGFPPQFDVIVGNPPYLSVDNYGRGTKLLQQQFPAIYRDKTDLSFYFLGLALRLAKRAVGMIVSRAFLEAYKADRLRRFILEHASVREIVDFGNDHVFEDAAISACILILDKTKTGEHGALRRGLRAEPVPIREIGSGPWVIVPDAVRDLNAKIDAAGTPIGEILVVGQGMQTGCNGVFGRRSRAEMEGWSAAPELCRKRATNTDIQRYSIRDRGEYLLYLEDVEDFGDLPRGVQEHLLAHEPALKARAAYLRGDCEWWKYTWPLHKRLYGRRRILCPYLAATNRFALDDRNEFLSLTDTTVLFENDQTEDMEYIVAILNSRLMEFRYRSIGKLKAKGIREYFWNGVSRLPIRRCSGNPLAHCSDLDQAVYRLYGVSSAEIRLLES